MPQNSTSSTSSRRRAGSGVFVGAVSGQYFTHAMWLVKPGAESEFQRVWREELAPAFRALAPDATGTLIQSLQNERLFYSFGPWDTLEELQRARADGAAQHAIAKLKALCEEASPGAYRL